MIETIFFELRELVNHTGVYVILFACLIFLVLIFKHDIRRKCPTIIKVNLAIFLFAVVLSLLAEHLLDRWSSIVASTNEVHVHLYRIYRLCDLISVYARFFSGIIIFCWSLWAIAKNLLSNQKKLTIAYNQDQKKVSNQSAHGTR
jgi:hypothetical protein